MTYFPVLHHYRFPFNLFFQIFYVSVESQNITIMSLILSYPHKSSERFVDFQSMFPISIMYICSNLIMQIYLKSLVTTARRKPLLKIFYALYTCFVNANTPRRWVVFSPLHETGIGSQVGEVIHCTQERQTAQDSAVLTLLFLSHAFSELTLPHLHIIFSHLLPITFPLLPTQTLS